MNTKDQNRLQKLMYEIESICDKHSISLLMLTVDSRGETHQVCRGYVQQLGAAMNAASKFDPLFASIFDVAIMKRNGIEPPKSGQQTRIS